MFFSQLRLSSLPWSYRCAPTAAFSSLSDCLPVLCDLLKGPFLFAVFPLRLVWEAGDRLWDRRSWTVLLRFCILGCTYLGLESSCMSGEPASCPVLVLSGRVCSDVFGVIPTSGEDCCGRAPPAASREELRTNSGLGALQPPHCGELLPAQQSVALEEPCRPAGCTFCSIRW